MPKQKQQQPAIRRFSFRHDPSETMSATTARPAMNEAETQAASYIEQLAEAERRAGRKVTRVHTRRVRTLAHNRAISPNRLWKPRTVGHEIIRTFTFK